MIAIKKTEIQICSSLERESDGGLRPYTILVREDGDFDDGYPSNTRYNSLTPQERDLQAVRQQAINGAARVSFTTSGTVTLNRPDQLLLVDNVVLDRVLRARREIALYEDLGRSGLLSMVREAKLHTSVIRQVEGQNLMEAVTGDLTGQLTGRVEEIIYLQ